VVPVEEEVVLVGVNWVANIIGNVILARVNPGFPKIGEGLCPDVAVFLSLEAAH